MAAVRLAPALRMATTDLTGYYRSTLAAWMGGCPHLPGSHPLGLGIWGGAHSLRQAFDTAAGGLALWFAVPKNRVTRSRKRMRTQDRKQKPIVHYSTCVKCGQPKLRHKFCENIELCAAGNDELRPLP